MTEKKLTENLKGKNNYFSSERKDMKFLKVFTLFALIPFWVGYALSLYNGDNSNLLNYSLLILAFSLMNFNTLCGVEKIKNKAVDLLARIEGILFFAWIFITVVQILIK